MYVLQCLSTFAEKTVVGSIKPPTRCPHSNPQKLNMLPYMAKGTLNMQLRVCWRLGMERLFWILQ